MVNEVEGAFLAGTEAPEAILDTLAARYPETTGAGPLGEQGAAAARGAGGPGAQPGKTAVVDTTAAGDTFTGYFLRRALEGGTLEEALSLAAAASALAVSRPGAADAVPDMKRSCGSCKSEKHGSPGRNPSGASLLSCGPLRAVGLSPVFGRRRSLGGAPSDTWPPCGGRCGCPAPPAAPPASGH